MKGSLRIATVAGTGVFLHWSFLLLITWLFAAQLATSGLAAALETLAFVSAIFLCVTLHELGHVLMARRFGVRTRDITLLPIGGVARLRNIPKEPYKELLIALAGPAVNVAIAAMLFVGMAVSGVEIASAGVGLAEISLLNSLMWFNVIVVAFNMLPAFPMDGGRVFRALLARRRTYLDATRTAARLGQAIAVVFFTLGLFVNWVLAIIGVFVFLGAAAEARTVEVHAMTENATVYDAMVTDFRMLSGGDSLGDAAEALLTTSQSEFPVHLHDGRLGLLTRNTLLRHLQMDGPRARIGQVIECAAPKVTPGQPLDRVADRMAETGGAVIVVNSLGEVVGLLTPENVQEWILVEQAMDAFSKGPATTMRVHPSNNWYQTTPGAARDPDRYSMPLT